MLIGALDECALYVARATDPAAARQQCTLSSSSCSTASAPMPASDRRAMQMFVVGGTGAVGGHAIPALVREGHSVTALARTPEKAAALIAQGATPLSVSLFDRSALTAVFTGHDAVVNLATAIPSMSRWMSAKAWRSNDRVRTEGSGGG